ncbi:hypothetical protein V1477_015847 [Vespula maculifrons]|uniref:Uncharacterized protein n=2 Tax=Vespula TaxID=7451 RepID=A0A834K296_VESVU|nr:hypothetical protein HZH66_006442 [Vespula vulgaris]
MAGNYRACRWTIKRDKINEHSERYVETACYPKETPPIVKYEFAHFPPVIREDREQVLRAGMVGSGGGGGGGGGGDSSEGFSGGERVVFAWRRFPSVWLPRH